MSISTIIFGLAMAGLLLGLLVQKTQFGTKYRQYLLFSSGWILFGTFWISRFPYYVFKTRSFIYLLMIPIVVVGCFLLAVSAINAIRNNETLPKGFFTVTISGTIASLIYMPFTLIDFLRRTAIESVTVQTHTLMNWMGITNVQITAGPEFGYQSGLLFETEGMTYLTYIAQNCTGIGSMAVVVAILWVTNLSVHKKIAYSIVSLLVIHILNLGRNVMIAVGYGHQWFNSLEPTLAPLLGYEDPHLVSFFIADKILAQLGSAIALLIIFYIFLKKFPELQDRLVEVLELFKEQVPDTVFDK